MFYNNTIKILKNPLIALFSRIYRKNTECSCSVKIANSNKSNNIKDFLTNSVNIIYPHEALPNCKHLSKKEVVSLLKEENEYKKQILEDNERLRNELFKKECREYLKTKKKN